MAEPGAATLRLFIAVPIPVAVRTALADRLAGERQRHARARWQSPETWHLTLRFLGDTPAEVVPAIGDAMRLVARSQSPFEIRLGGTGVFERRRGPRVAWLGVTQGSAELTALATALARALRPDAADAEPPFRPHLTLAREAPPGIEVALAEVFAPVVPDRSARRADDTGPSALAWLADRLVLYRSELGRDGARHSALLEAALGGQVEGSGKA
jgi:2'-5' RNA ligase